jgi:hypothetical protein
MPSTRLFAALLLFAPHASVADAVHAAQRIREGETIRAEALRMRPIDTDDAATFRSTRDLAGRVALANIDEGAPVPRDAVGDVPERQFRIDATTPVRVVYTHSTGPVLPGARRSVSCTRDTANLSSQDASALRDLVRDSGVLLAPPSAFEQLVGGSDDTLLRITVNATTKSVHWSGRRAPESVQPLVRHLAGCAVAR